MNAITGRTATIRPFLAVVVCGLLLLAAGCGGQAGGPAAGDVPDAFKQMARVAPCADVDNRLFLIDGELVFWNVEGNCADASYSRTLFGSAAQEVLCESHDSIAGPMESCQDDTYQALFGTITTNLDKPGLGLGADHTVVPVPF